MRTRDESWKVGWYAMLIVAMALVLGLPGGDLAAAQATPAPTGPIRIVSPAAGEEVAGPDVAITWEAPGLTIVPAADAKVETDLHAHFIVDGAYEVVEGTPIPKQCGVLHTAANPATLTGLAPGEHTVQLVIANPGHVPVPGLERPSVTFTVAESPDAIRITSPANCERVAGPDVEIAWQAPGLTIVPAAEAKTETDYHAHFIVDGAYEVVEGAPIPMQDGVVHTAANPATVTGLAPGEHTIQLVIANPGHVPVPDLARPTVTIVVGEAGAAATPAGATPVASATPPGAAATVTMKDIAFDPTAITIPANVDAVVALTNVGSIQHDFTIDALNVKVTLDPGQSGSATISAPAGTYEYYCSIPGHKAAGMVGTLTVQ